MKTTEDTVIRFLLPLDTEGSRVQSVELMKCLAVILGQRVEKITLFHVMAGKYLSRHMANIDFRAQNIISTDKFKELRQGYIDREIRPVLETAKKELEDAGVRAAVDIMIEDGDPVRRIIDKANKEGYSALVLQRSDLSRVGEMFVGSVTSGVLHREVKSSIYLPGTKVIEQGCSPKCCLVALDESENAGEALARASVLAVSCAETIEKVILVHVLDISECVEALSGGQVPVQSTDDLLDNAAAFLKSQGLGVDKISKVAACGDPAEVLIDVADKEDVDVIFMGRRGRGAVKELFMGSVSRKIIYRCPAQTIMLVNID